MWKELPWRCLVPTFVCLFLTGVSATRADEVLYWNSVLLDSIRAEHTPPPAASRKMAITHIAIYDAVNSIHQDHMPYSFFAPAPAHLPQDAAIAAAAHEALSALFPEFAGDYEAEFQERLSHIPGGHDKDAAMQLGRAAASAILAERAYDPSGTTAPGSPPALGPGVWRPTQPGYVPYLLPGWAVMPPFAMHVPYQFRRPGPPKLKSGEYAQAFNRVKSIGGKYSTKRTAEQTEIALFWADGAGTVTPPGHWNVIAQEVADQMKLSSADNARLFALLNIALADAAIVAWDMKFDDYLWRPITAIREADQDGNSKTQADRSWEPLIPTPPFPSYVSGHSTFSGAAATLLQRFFGTDRIAFIASSDGLPGVHRCFGSFSEAADEAGQSRIYGGIHFDFDDEDGQRAGKKLADHVFSHFMRKKKK